MKNKSIENGIIVTMNPERKILKDGTIVIEGNKIIDIGKTEQMRKKHNTDIRINAKNKLVIPGLVNLHFHPGNMIRGIGEHMSLEEWAQNILYPYLSAMEPKDAYLSAVTAYAESLLTGTTTINGMYHYIVKLAEAAEDIGMRTVLASEASDSLEDQPTLEDNEKALKKCEKFSDRIKVWFGVEWLPISSREFLIKARNLADKHNTGIHIHLNESSGEVKACLKKHGKRPTELAHELGLLGTDVVAAHCVWLSDAEKKIYAETGTHISHNPVSNAKFGNGIASIPDLSKLGVNIGLGTDDAACNDTFHMFETMKFASLMQKAIHFDAKQMMAEKVFEMATINGAKALGMEGQIGSLEKGKKADIVLLDLETPNLRPIHLSDYSNIYQNLIYSSPTNAVHTVIVDGKTIVENKTLKTINLHNTLEEHQIKSKKILERRKDYIKEIPL